jgi:hypothetical protein
MSPKEHNKLLGIFLMVHGGLQAVMMAGMGLVYGGIGGAMVANAQRDQERMVGTVFLVVVAFLLVFTFIFAVPQLFGGWKVFKESPGARTWGIVASIIALIAFPLGTAAGVYGLWFLFGEAGKQFYAGGAPNQYSNPPGAHNWQ